MGEVRGQVGVAPGCLCLPMVIPTGLLEAEVVGKVSFDFVGTS